MSPDEILDRAADIIDERGLAQGAFQDAAGRVCALGAIAAACGLGPRTFLSVSSVTRPAVDALKSLLPKYACGYVGDWSDRQPADGKAVVRKLRQAAETVRGEA